jgi:hypothetical protein
MLLNYKKLTIPLLLLTMVFIASCEKDAGEGGSSSITGNVHTTDYNATFLIVQGEYPAADEDVYIIYGDETSYGDRVKTSYDGRFEFKYLREGKYTIYTYSDDTTLSGKSVVSVAAEITKKKQTVDVGQIEIKKN